MVGVAPKPEQLPETNGDIVWLQSGRDTANDAPLAIGSYADGNLLALVRAPGMPTFGDLTPSVEGDALLSVDSMCVASSVKSLGDFYKRGVDMAIGVRNQSDGTDMRSRRSLPRRLAGQLFALAMRVLVLPDIGDSQCPLKAFKRSAAQRLFRLQRIDTWAFDAELLFLADRLGL